MAKTDKEKKPNANQDPQIAPQTFAVDETALSAALVGAVLASDPNGDPLTYSILAGNDSGAFAIDPITGDITVANPGALDYELTQSYSLSVRVSDGARSAFAIVSIEVTDENEVPDGGDDLAVSAAEDVGDALVLAAVVASDPDVGGGNDGVNDFENLAFAIAPASNPAGLFEIDLAGQVSLAAGASFDFEMEQVHALSVWVSDGPGLSDEVVVTIAVTDVNEQPSAGPDLTVTATEDIADSAVLAMVVGTDPDVGGGNDDTSDFEDILYQILSGGDPSDLFEVSATGHISLQPGDSLDFEAAQSHTVIVRVSDAPALYEDVAVTIDVVDVNEQPSAGADVTASAAETVDDTTVLAAVAASDPDVGGGNDGGNDFENLTYVIATASNPAGQFEIDSTGQVSLAAGASLDFELEQVHALSVWVSDGPGLSDEVVVTIAVMDVNEQPSAGVDLTVTATEDAPDSAVLTTVVATDPDQGGGDDAASDFENLSYGIAPGGDPSALFEISASGQLSLKPSATLDFEQAQQHGVTIRVTDGAGLFDDVTVTISVTDADEFDVTTPQDADPATNQLPEFSPNGTTVGLIAFAIDADGTTNAVSYILDDDAGGRFAIHAATGVVTVANGGALDFESAAGHTIKARATSADGSSSTATFAIALTNVNEPPLAVDDVVTASEDTPLVIPPATLLANDTDPDGADTKTLVSVQGAVNGSVSLAGGQVTFTPAAGFTGAASFSYTIKDGGNATSTANVAVTVVAANQAPAFGGAGDGVAVVPFGGADMAMALAVAPDGRIVVAGRGSDVNDYDFAMARLNADGSLDPGFSGDGRLLTDFGGTPDEAFGLALQPDGKLLVGGRSNHHFAIARYHADGTLDTSFAGGKVTTVFSTGPENASGGVTVQPDGKVLLVGHTGEGVGHADFAMLRYNPDGTLDTTFDLDGKVRTSFGSFATVDAPAVVQDDGKLVLFGQAGGNFAIARYNTNGSLDPSFHDDGRVTTDFGGVDQARGGVVLADGKLLAGGFGFGDPIALRFALARYYPDGSLDTSFGVGGKVLTDVGGTSGAIAYDMAVQADGKIVLAGARRTTPSAGDITLARYDVDGTLDPSFGGTGVVVTSLTAGVEEGLDLEVQADGRIVVAGYAPGSSVIDAVVLRYLPDGSLDPGFDAAQGLNGTVTYVESGAPVVLDADVNVSDPELDALNGGLGDYAGASLVLARAGGAAAQDSFGFAAAGASFTASAGKLQAGGQTFGAYTQAGGVLTIDFTSSGTPATGAQVDDVLRHVTYANTSTAPPASVQVAWTFSDGNMGSQGGGGALVASGSTNVVIQSVNAAPTLNTVGDGVVVTPFGAGGMATALAIAADGRIVVAGRGSEGAGIDFAVARHYPGGGLDASFSGDGKLFTDFAATSDEAFGLALQPDGKLLVGGRSDHHFAIARYHADGALDTSFGGGKVTTVFSTGPENASGGVTVQPDGKVLLVGHTGEGVGHADFAMLRYDANGTLDPTFGLAGKVRTPFSAFSTVDAPAVVLADGRLLLFGQAGNDFAIARYHANGSLDTSFHDDGKVTTDFGGIDQARGGVVLADGKLLAGGFGFGNPVALQFALARYHPDGSLDTSFGVGGKVLTDVGGTSGAIAYDMAVQADGKIVLAGARSAVAGDGDITLARYHPNGSLDTSFGVAGIVVTALSGTFDEALDVAVQADGGIVVAGYSTGGTLHAVILRYSADGSLDTSFDARGVPDQVTTQGEPFQLTLPAGLFSDPDGDPLTYSATLSNGAALPGWLSVDPETGALSGTPGSGDLGSMEVELRATDPHGLFAADVFLFSVT